MGFSTGAFSRASSRLFAHFAEEAFFRGAVEPVFVVISREVQILGEYGQVERVVTTATLASSLAPKKGDALTFSGEAWTLDAPLRGDRADVVEWVLLPVAP